MKQRRMDYHLHTVYSFDGKQTLPDLCRRMTELGVEEICLTEHIDPGSADPLERVYPDWDKLFAEADACRAAFPQLTIRCGLEIGDSPECRAKIRALLDRLPLDFRLLSLHAVHGIDPYDQRFFLGKTREEAYREYAKVKADSVCAWEDFDSVAHIGYVAKFAPYEGALRPFRYEDAPEDVDRLLKHVIRLGKCIEVNTAGYAKTGDVQPHSSILARYIQLGGEVFTFGSDSHDVARDYDRVEEAKAQVKRLGGKYQAGFEGRRRTLYAL